MVNMKKKSKQKQQTIVRLDIGCGQNKREGFFGVDISKNVNPDYCFDVRKTPWPFEDNSIDEIYASHFVEHLDGTERISFFNEAYRVMKSPKIGDDGVEIKSTMTVITPAPFTHRYMQDPTHKFPMVVQEFYNYLHEESRKAMGVNHYPITCNFEWNGFFQEQPEAVAGRNDEYKQHAARHLINTLLDLVVTLTKK